jgi:glycine/D-amino acid oxidase-like deaminating enzyme
MSTEQVIVLGAGFQGVCVALGLQRQGHSVTLVDKAPDCMMRASLRNEGKIHLGFVYANDTSFRTSSLMLRSSLTFARLIEEWLKARIDWAAITSRPFTYAIARDSLLSPATLLASYEKLQKTYREMRDTEGSNYLGNQLSTLWQEAPLNTSPPWVNEKFVVKSVETVEAALDAGAFRRILRAALDRSDKVEQLYSHKVESAVRTSNGFRVTGTHTDGSEWTREAGIVVNCLWEGRLELDQQMGVLPQRKWVYRLKYRLLGELPQSLVHVPSLTMVLGPYGDIVIYPSAKTYISWYPACMRGWCSELTPPQAWESACAGQAESKLAAAITQEALTALDNVVPGILRSKVDVVDACIIFSWGESDISDPQSELHERFDIGVQSYDGYYSIDTGKFTCAPLFAQQFLNRIR